MTIPLVASLLEHATSLVRRAAPNARIDPVLVKDYELILTRLTQKAYDEGFAAARSSCSLCSMVRFKSNAKAEAAEVDSED